MTTIDCKDCGKAFQFTQAERERYANKGFAPPKRCRACRVARRAKLPAGSEAASRPPATSAGAAGTSDARPSKEPRPSKDARAGASSDRLEPHRGSASSDRLEPHRGSASSDRLAQSHASSDRLRPHASSDRLEPISDVEDFDALDEDGVLDLPDVPRSPLPPRPAPRDEDVDPDDEPHVPDAKRESRPSPGSRASSTSSGRLPKQEFDVVCSACGAPTKVPFKPTAKRPVYCAACFEYR